MTVKICLWWHGYFELILPFCIIYSLRQEHTEWCNTYRKLVWCHQIDQTHADKNLRPIWCRSCTGSACRAGGAAPNALVQRSASGQQKQSAEPEPFSVRRGARVEKPHQMGPYYNRANTPITTEPNGPLLQQSQIVSLRLWNLNDLLIW